MEAAVLPFLIVPAVLAVTVHEIAHGWVALQMGDRTAADAGRLSFNPLRHVDPIGTLAVPAVLFAGGQLLTGSGFFFGWAKPVPVHWGALHPLRPGIAAVAAAGPGANLLMLGAWAVTGLVMVHAGVLSDALIYMCQAGIIFNAAIMIINLIPIPPLDGSRIVTAMLPAAWARRFNRLEPYGLLIVVGAAVALSATGRLETVFAPLFGLANRILHAMGM